MRMAKNVILSLLCIAGAGPARANEVRISVQDTLCADALQIARDIDAVLSAEVQGPLSIQITSPRPGTVRVEATGPGAERGRWDFAFQQGECRDLSTTVALMIQGWLAKDWDKGVVQ